MIICIVTIAITINIRTVEGRTIRLIERGIIMGLIMDSLEQVKMGKDRNVIIFKCELFSGPTNSAFFYFFILFFILFFNSWQ